MHLLRNCTSAGPKGGAVRLERPYCSSKIHDKMGRKEHDERMRKAVAKSIFVRKLPRIETEISLSKNVPAADVSR